MSEQRDPLLDAIHAAGEVPPPPDRDAAFARAMQPVLMPSRRRLSRGFIALFAAALIGAPAAVYAAHVTHEHAAITTPIVAEIPDPGSAAIHRESDDVTVKRASGPAHEAEHQGTMSSSDDHSGSTSTTTADDHSGSGSPSSGSGDSSGSGSGTSGSGEHPSASPTPTPSSTESSGSNSGPGGGSPDGGTLSGSSDGGTPTPSPSGTTGTH